MDYQLSMLADRPNGEIHYHIGVDGTRDQVLKKYREYLEASPGLVNEAKKELRGKNLACWCQPTEDCHADILLEIANK